MGLGDWIMATAEASHYHALYGTKCVFALKDTIFYEPDVFANNPKICKNPGQGEKVVVINNGPGKRPYMLGMDSKRWAFNTDFKNVPGEIYLTPEEIKEGEIAKGLILIEPYVKPTGYSENKHWPHWDAFINLAQATELGPLLAQMRYDNRSSKVRMIKTRTFRQALGAIHNCRMVITPDGALHHASAALNVPCIALWGGLVTPDILGYETQVNIWHGAKACGSFGRCEHCREAMKAITPEEVLEQALLMYRNTA